MGVGIVSRSSCFFEPWYLQNISRRLFGGLNIQGELIVSFEIEAQSTNPTPTFCGC